MLELLLVALISVSWRGFPPATRMQVAAVAPSMRPASWLSPCAGRTGPAAVRSPSRRLLSGHRAQIEALRFSPDGRTLASSGKDGTIRLWGVATGSLRHILRSPATGLVFSADSRFLMTTDGSSGIRVWNIATGGVGRVVRLPGARLGPPSASPDGRLLAVPDKRHNRLLLMDPRTWRVTRQLKGDPPLETRRGPGFSADAWINAACFSADRRFLATEHQDSSTDMAGVHFDSWIRIWRTATWQRAGKLEPLSGPRASLDAFAMAADGQKLAGMTSNGTGASLLTAWNLRTGERRRLGEYERRCHALAFAAGGTAIVAGMQESSGMAAYALVLDADTGDERCRLQTDRVASLPEEAAGTLAVSPDGRLLATVSPGHRLQLRRMADLLAGRQP